MGTAPGFVPQPNLCQFPQGVCGMLDSAVGAYFFRGFREMPYKEGCGGLCGGVRNISLYDSVTK